MCILEKNSLLVTDTLNNHAQIWKEYKTFN